MADANSVAAQAAAEAKVDGKVSALNLSEIQEASILLDARQMPSVILMGEMGSGKTHSLRSLLVDKNGKFEGPSLSGIEKVCVVACEPGIEDVVGDIPEGKLAWHNLPVGEGTFQGLIDMVQKINTLHPDVIQAGGGIGRQNYQEMLKLLGLCNKFTDDRTGEDLGTVFKFPQTWCLWFESISALTEIAKNNAIGDKPFMELRDYQMVQATVIKFLHQLVFNTKCLFVSTGHLERETNENTGATELMLSTIGRKLAPRIPRFFSDCIYTTRDDTVANNPSFWWATQVPNVRTKTRNLPWSPKMKPDFKPLIDNFRIRQEKARAEKQAKITPQS